MKAVSRRSATLLVGVAAAAIAVAVAASGATARPAATQVCVLLPDTTTSVRWQQFDAPAFKNAFKKAGLSAAVVNALGQPQKQLAQAEQCISDGAKVGVITDLDRGTSIAIQKKFTAVGGKTIDYDRQIVGGTGSVYVSFDGNLVGRQQALGVLGGMKAKGTYGPSGTIAQLWGGPTDANAFWFKSGNDDILNPLFKAKKVKKGPAKFVPLWSSDKAQVIFEQMLVQTNSNIQGVVAANDGIAGAVVADERHDLARADLEIDVGQCLHRAERLREVADLEEWCIAHEWRDLRQKRRRRRFASAATSDGYLQYCLNSPEHTSLRFRNLSLKSRV